MKIAVIGAGVVGVTTAYELSAQGHEVNVFEKNGAAAEECSFASSGITSAAYVSLTASSDIVKQILFNALKKDKPFRLSNPSLKEISWLWQASKNTSPKTLLKIQERLLKLAIYSDSRKQSLTDSLRIEHEKTNGFLAIFRTEREQKLYQSSIELMRNVGLNLKTLNSEAALGVEPALNPETPFFQALHLPDDDVSNSRQFTLILKNEAESLGANFHFNAPVLPLSIADSKTIRTSSQKYEKRFDAVVVCAGLASAQLIRPLGIKIPLCPINAYSVSAAIRETLDAPRSSIMDSKYNVLISRIGQRVRISGGSSIGGGIRSNNPASLRTLYKVLDDWFPGAARTQDNVQVWQGAQPSMPDSTPIIGQSGIAGIWLNLGHGASGWALACGSARALADSINGRTPQIDIQGLGLERLIK